MGRIGCARCEKSRHDFVARTFALIAPFHPILAPSFMQLRNDNRWTQTLWNLPKLEFRVQWGGLGAFVAKKFWCDFMARTSALIAPVQPDLHRVSCSNETLANAPKHYEMHTNISLGSNGVDWVRSLWKILMRLQGTNFCTNCTSSTLFAPSFV